MWPVLVFLGGFLLCTVESFQNPVLYTYGHKSHRVTFLNESSEYIAIADHTYFSGAQYPLYISSDLQHWTLRNYTIPYVDIGPVKGPVHMIPINESVYNFYYMHRYDRIPNVFIVATCASPYGSFLPASGLLGPQTSNADPFAFKDNGKFYLFYVADTSTINIVQLSNDGLDTLSAPTKLILSDQSWETTTVGAPYVVERNEYYYLFYSAGDLCDSQIGVARSPFIDGPYVKMSKFLALNSTNVKGFHTPNVVPDRNSNTTADVLIYSAFRAKECSDPYSTPMMMAQPLTWSQDGWPVVTVKEACSCA